MKIRKSRLTFVVILAAVVAALTTAAVFMAKAYAKRRCLSTSPEEYDFDCDFDVCDCDCEEVDMTAEEAAQVFSEQDMDHNE